MKSSSAGGGVTPREEGAGRPGGTAVVEEIGGLMQKNVCFLLFFWLFV